MPMTRDSDALAVRASQGDKSALGQLYERYADRVWKYAYRQVNFDHGAADEVASMLWLRVLDQIPQYDPNKGTFAGWVFYRAKQAVVDHLRSSASRERLVDSLTANSHHVSPRTPEEHVISQSNYDTLMGVIALLPLNHKTAVLLTIHDGLSDREAGEIMGAPPATIRQWRHRAIVSLRQNLHGKGVVDGRVGVTKSEVPDYKLVT